MSVVADVTVTVGPRGPAGTTGPPGAAGGAGPQGQAGPAGPAGQSFTWRGLWASGTTYALDDAVQGSDGSAYISLQPGNVGHDPTSSPTWWSVSVLHGQAGLQGPTGATGNAGAPGPNTIQTASDFPAATDSRYLRGSSVKMLLPSGDATGATDTAAINAALAAYAQVWLAQGLFYINGSIRIGSNNTLILADATVFLVAGSNCNLVLNVDYLGTSGGNTNIRILGLGTALFDQNSANQTYSSATTAPAQSWKGHGILLSNVTNYEVRDIQFRGLAYYGISPQQATDGLIRNIYASNPGPLTNAIVQTMGRVTRLKIENVRGVSEDDSVALSTGDMYSAFYADQTKVGAAAGDVTDVVIRDVRTSHNNTAPNAAVHQVAMFTGSGCKMQRIQLHGIYEQFPTQNQGQIGIGITDFFIQAPATQAGPSDLSDITITDTNCRVVFSGSAAGVKISKVSIPNQSIANDIAPFMFTGGQGGTTYTNISFDDVLYNGPVSTHALFEMLTGSGPLYAAGAVTINGLRITNVRSNGNAPALISNGGATITSLFVRSVDTPAFSGGVFKAGGSGTVQGTVNDVTIDTAITGAKWGSQPLSIACGLITPVWTIADPTPAGIDGAVINADGSVVLDAGTAVPATYLYRQAAATYNLPALVAHASAAFSTPSSGATTPAIDTTGATFLVATLSWFSNIVPTFTDSKGNTWTRLTVYATSAPYKQAQYICTSPVAVGAGHTFTFAAATNCYGVLAVAAYSGAGTPTLDSQAGATSASTTVIQPGSLTTVTNELVVSGLTGNNSAAATIDSGMTILEQIPGTANHIAVGLAAIIRTTGAVVNPTWSAAFGSLGEAASIASFSFRSGGGAGAWHRLTN